MPHRSYYSSRRGGQYGMHSSYKPYYASSWHSHKWRRSRSRSHRGTMSTRWSSRGYDDYGKKSKHYYDTQSSTTSYSSETAGSSVSSDHPPAKGKDDDIVHFEWKKGDRLGDSGRYICMKHLGDGTFGRVIGCADTLYDNQMVAVKVIRDVQRYKESAEIEAEILERLNRRMDKLGLTHTHTHIVRLYETFYHHQYYCLAFEVLGCSLYDLIKANNYRGLFITDVQALARALFKSLQFCHDELHLTHTDLKPENVLFMHATTKRDGSCYELESADLPRRLRGCDGSSRRRTKPYLRPKCDRMKVIDFGNGTFRDDHHSSVVNTRQYRSPEVILGHGWSEVSDMWSVGCILMEAYSGELLFPTHDNLEHLHMMERVLDRRFSSSYLGRSNSESKAKLLTLDRHSQWTLHGIHDHKHLQNIQDCRPLRRMVAPGHELLADLVEWCLEVDPSRRITASEALDHEFMRIDFTHNE
ncbi:serine-threonine protein kinase, putative [Perkinsus marinus ATCC 50983]|uniref:Serine-threonine protein kinase, putative n=1 Tax=Perkinsus marinus (strain ATCC 50983 / TXsc) TaxID=423536 RepID=C5L6S6_PERM5|nr:serine-threonine protein kinase, putative [Perkinsus marinus ATCC 50983]EER07566.1 serine-threonine protein kinase, putative [Perkinsus marinus ATCC 50983]|eukprot:XP_002775750.1 serine-threonine protein kinase, putative [Perkinsus marinus ATCC 50983]